MAASKTLSIRDRGVKFIRSRSFKSSGDYWESRYQAGQNSGAGSYGRLAEYKADFLNDLVSRTNVASIIELGCGDGAQLALATYPRYVGIDVAETAVEMCRKKFETRPELSFFHASDSTYRDEKYDLAMSLDVIYHLVEDDVFNQYMTDLFSLSEKAIVVYASNNDAETNAVHVRHRKFTNWIEANEPTWSLAEHAPNPYPIDPTDPGDTTFADFYVFTKS